MSDNYSLLVSHSDLEPHNVLIKLGVCTYSALWGEVLTNAQNLLYSVRGIRSEWPLKLVDNGTLTVDKLGPQTYLLRPEGHPTIDATPDEMTRLAQALIGKARQVEEHSRTLAMWQKIQDQKLLLQKGVPLLLTANRKALLVAQNEAGMSIPSGTIVSPPAVTLLQPNGQPVTQNKSPRKRK